MTDHNYANCDDPLCLVCEGYWDGYVDGKSKALFEVSTQKAGHAAGCGCGPCLVVKNRLRRSHRAGGATRSGRTLAPGIWASRGALPASLKAELALLLGIELSDGDLL